MDTGSMRAQNLELIPVQSSNHRPKVSVYFSSDGNKLFGWLHRPLGDSTSNVGLVICSPFGYESTCSHRTVRALAEAAAAMGVPTLRFDYAGTGDSCDIEPGCNQLDVWSSDVVAAASELKRLTGVDKVCLLGLRLGALLATLAAPRCVHVSGLVLISPVLNGRRLLRELRTARLAAALAMPVTVEPQASGLETGSLEFSGFPLSSATMSALSQIDLEASVAPAVSQMLIVDRKDLPVASKWAGSLSDCGTKVEYVALPDFVQIVMTPSDSAIIPHEMIAATCSWLQRHAIEEQRDHSNRSQACHQPVQTPEILILPAGEPQLSLTERPVSVAEDPFLFGIVTEPRSGETRRRAVILLNGGGVHHIGIFRDWVLLARRWARSGYVVLRLDMAGFGDSDTRPGRKNNEVFPPAALDDMRSAIDFMRHRYGVRDITLAGMCSGAYHALRAAAAGLAVNRILMVNPQNFFWKEGMTGDDMRQLTEAVLNPGGYRNRLLSKAHWARLLRGQVHLWTIPRVLVHRALMALESRFRDLARHLRIRLPRDLGSELEQIVGRGVRVVMVFARGEPGIDLLKIQAGSSIGRLGDRLHIHIVDGANHDFSERGSRTIMESILGDELSARSIVR